MSAPTHADGISAEAMRVIPPRRALHGRTVLPGSKSITNRALLLAALAKGESRLSGALKSDDTRYMAEALRAMGVTVEEPDAERFTVTSDGRLRAPTAPLFLGNAGTATRFLTAAAALAEGEVVVDGDAHMHKRPIAPLLDALAALGVEASAPTGCPPVTIQGHGRIAGGGVEIDANLSSQYVSALLMLAACADGPVEIALRGAEIGARGYLDLTLAAMGRFGAEIEALSGSAWRVAPTGYRAVELEIEPDASAATYFWAAGAITGGEVGVGLPPEAFSQPDAKAHALIAAFPHMPAEIDGSQMQDAIPTLAALAVFNTTPVRFTNLANLRVKECDRLAALATELSRVQPGLGVEEGDSLLVASHPALKAPSAPVRLMTYADHRMAMSLALLGLRLDNILIDDPACVAKTFPGYWDALGALGVEMERV